MTTTISTMSQAVLGVGHAMEDDNPVPIHFRNAKPSKPVNEKDEKTKHSLKTEALNGR